MRNCNHCGEKHPECPKCSEARAKGIGCKCGQPIASDWQCKEYQKKQKN